MAKDSALECVVFARYCRFAMKPVLRGAIFCLWLLPPFEVPVLAAEFSAPLKVLHHFSANNQSGYNGQGGLIKGSDGALYGTTSTGGRHDLGTIFSSDCNGGKYRLLHAFGDSLGDGWKPFAGLIEGSDGKLYGTTLAGGTSSQGAVFSVGKDGRDYSPIWTFTLNGPEGNHPYGSVLLDTNGAIYGVTTSGGAERQGAVFRLDRASR